MPRPFLFGAGTWSRAPFGPRVAGIVRVCTDADVLPKPPWQARKEASLAHLEHAEASVLRVSAADELRNARAICTGLRTDGRAVFNRFNAGQEGTLWYYGALSALFSRLPGLLAAELAGTVAEMRRLAAL